MKKTVESPWSPGDIGWAILGRSVEKKSHCEECGHHSRESEYVQEVRECQIDVVDIHLTKQGVTYWYTAGFDIGDTRYDTRFTYGTNGVKNIYATREEAEAALKKELE